VRANKPRWGDADSSVPDGASIRRGRAIGGENVEVVSALAAGGGTEGATSRGGDGAATAAGDFSSRDGRAASPLDRAKIAVDVVADFAGTAIVARAMGTAAAVAAEAGTGAGFTSRTERPGIALGGAAAGVETVGMPRRVVSNCRTSTAT
jgi:hypothetical protein